MSDYNKSFIKKLFIINNKKNFKYIIFITINSYEIGINNSNIYLIV